MLHQIGIGALGPVFRTYEPTRDRLVAVKVFRLDIVPEQAQALAAALGRASSASLFHPSIVEPIAAGVEGTLAYRAEEYVAAESLDVAMRHYAPAGMDKVLPFITQLAGAIDFARAAGVGHGGLHPRDIFVTPDDARATGFGVIEALEEVGIRAPVRRPYTAPERIEGKPWSTQADIFSLAAITFELLTGRRPAGTGTLIGALPESDHSAALHAVLARAMHDEPSQRYGSALAFGAALESAGRGQPDPPAVAEVTSVARPAAAAAVVSALPSAAPIREPEPSPAPPPRLPESPPPPPEPPPTVAPPPRAPSVHQVASEPAPLLFDAAEEPIAPPPAERFADDFTTDDEGPRLAYRRPEPQSPEPARSFEPFDPRELEPGPEALDPELLVRRESEPLETPELQESTEPSREAAMYDASDSSRPAVLPMALVGVLGLLAGFAGGYFVGSRDRGTPAPAAAIAAASSATPGSATAGGVPAASAVVATREQPGQYSEQKVSPPPATGTPAASASPTKPAEPPPIIQENPLARGAQPEASSAPRQRAPARATGTMIVKSTPSHAGVTVNSKWRGRTPLTLEHLPFGRYIVRIVQPGYHVAQEEFTLGARDADHTFSARLEPTAAAAARREPATGKGEKGESPTAFVGTLYVDSRPRGANVLLDGRSIGMTPLTLDTVPIGTHVVKIEMAGKRPWSSTTRVVAGETARVTGSLEDR